MKYTYLHRIPSSSYWVVICLNTIVATLNGQTIPSLDWGTYHGGIMNDDARDMAYDPVGFIYIIGSAESPDGISTPGSHQEGHSGSLDAFVAKYTLEGVMIWSTYFGGPEEERGQSIHVDNDGNVVITGITASTTGIATSNAFQPAYQGGGDAFVAKFNSDGVLLWSTYWGGSGLERANSIFTDSNNDIVVTGWTETEEGLASTGAYQETFGGGRDDAFVLKFSSEGDLIWSTYYGGSGGEQGLKNKENNQKKIVLLVFTNSPASMASADAWQTSFGGGNADVFLAVFDENGQRIWGTYYGGALDDYGDALALGTDGTIYIGGPCNSTNALTSPGVHQETIAGAFEGFIAKFTPEGQRIWGSYLGGESDDALYALDVHPGGDVFVAGYTRSDNGISTPDAFQTSRAGDWDAFLVRFTSDGQREWGTYYGGTQSDRAFGLKRDSENRLYLTGHTGSLGGISTPGSFQETFGGGNEDAFIVRFSDCQDPELELLNGGYICEPADVVLELQFTGTPPFTFTYSIDGEIQDPITTEESVFVLEVLLPWNDSIKLLTVNSGDCVGIITGEFAFAKAVPEIELTPLSFECNNDEQTYILFIGLSGGVFNYIAAEGTEGFIDGDVFTSASIPFGVPYDIGITTSLGCEPATIQGEAPPCFDCPDPVGTPPDDTLVCLGDDVVIRASGGIIYQWFGPNNFFSEEDSIVFNNISINDAGDYVIIIQDEEGCEEFYEFTVTVSLFEPSVEVPDPVCEGDLLILMASGGDSYQWAGPEGFSSMLDEPILESISIVNAGTYTVDISNFDGCSTLFDIEVMVNPLPVFSLSAEMEWCSGEDVQIFLEGEGESFGWRGPANFIASTRNVLIQNAGVNRTGVYTVRVVSSDFCSAFDSIELTVFMTPVAVIEGPDNICSGLEMVLTGSGGESFLWNDGSTSGQFTDIPAATTTYTLEVSNGPCSDETEWTVIVNESPDLMISGDVSINLGSTAQLNATGADLYLWFPFTDLDCTDCPDPIASPKATTQYCVTGESNGCTQDLCLTVFVTATCDVTLANVFSPNNDGFNDEWCSSIRECFSFQRLSIFDRWGNRIYFQSGEEVCWDGRFSNHNAIEGVYVYTLELILIDGTTSVVKGDILLLR